MLHKVLLGLAALLLLLVFYLAYSLVKTRFATLPAPRSPVTLGEPSSRRLRDHVLQLSTVVGTRSVYEFAKLEAVKDYLAARLREIGYTPTFQAVPFAGKTYANVLATLPGTGHPEETVLIGAHYDSAEGTPGADDNASAVAVLLELARALHGTAAQRTVKLAFFTLEEPPVFPSRAMGSGVFATGAKARGEIIHAMLSLEMVGYYHDREGGQAFPLPGMGLVYPTTPNFLAVVGNMASRHLTRQVRDSFRAGCDLPVESLATVRFLPGVDLSDHRWFWKLGYPAVMVTDTAFYRNPNYHAASDTADTLDYGKMVEVVQGMVRVVWDLAGRPRQSADL